MRINNSACFYKTTSTFKNIINFGVGKYNSNILSVKNILLFNWIRITKKTQSNLIKPGFIDQNNQIKPASKVAKNYNNQSII